MMDQYTPQAREALSLAVSVAESLNHGYVGTEHLLSFCCDGSFVLV